MIRAPYTTKFRPFKDDPREVDIVWYPALPDAPWLPFPSGVVNLAWDVPDRVCGIYFDKEFGEVKNRPRPGNKEEAKPQALGNHICGTPEMFQHGATFDPSVNRPKRPDGLPACCGAMPGGVIVGGRVVPGPRAGALVGGHDLRIVSAGTSEPDPGYVFQVGFDGPTLGYRSGSPTIVDRITILGVRPVVPFRFQLWAPTDVSAVTIVNGTGFPPNGWQHTFSDPTAGYFEWVQAPANLFAPVVYWTIIKPDTVVRGYVIAVTLAT